MIVEDKSSLRKVALAFSATLSRMVQRSFTLLACAFDTWRAHMAEVDTRLAVTGLIF